MFKYNVVDDKHSLVMKECLNLDEAIGFVKPMISSTKKKIRIKKIDLNNKVVREFSFIHEEGKDIIMSYIDDGGMVISSPI